MHTITQNQYDYTALRNAFLLGVSIMKKYITCMCVGHEPSSIIVCEYYLKKLRTILKNQCIKIYKLNIKTHGRELKNKNNYM